MRWGALLGFFLVVALGGQAQEVKVAAKLDKASILMGDQTVLRLTASVPKGTELSFPLLTDTLSSKVLVVLAGPTDTTVDKSGARLLSRSYVITAFEPGVQVVPAQTFRSGDKTFTTEALPLEVKGVAVDTTKAIYDIKQPISVSYTFIDWLRDNWHWLVIGLAVFALLVVFWLYRKKLMREKPVVVQKAEPEKPAHELALEQLQALDGRNLWQQGEVKGYYIELTDIIRLYVERRYGIHAQEQTTDEILKSLEGKELPGASRTSLRELLVQADLVKFAKAIPVGTENALCMQWAMRFVEDTKGAFIPQAMKGAGNDVV
ncbi:hypothetical protein [Pedobacter sp. JY14-1]|uniref:hypothetical protein n=1 Tax=Pedobacter sp. JY14-1 TaxID=3034151 RepID=UPI0023E0D851|nr:hypothetical protein [Pedobacter sp. JY14-1]